MRYGLPNERWRKSSYSNGGSGNCVETQLTEDGLIAIGDSKDRSQGALVVPAGGWKVFIASLKAGAHTTWHVA
ncbi:DUF397 domain-containing protein [Streptomyces sodiiphilus]|uniref:DUF397 domain-containing protein n=1 Tax=Streptomyces sodiiphilus TaxID=226217 RepID=A0ABP5AH21_9ACTN